MRFPHGLLIALIAIVGCDTLKNVKVENPVMPPPPPRVSRMDVEERKEGSRVASFSSPASDTESSEIAAGFSQSGDDSRNEKFAELSGNHVVAYVNSEPIFAAEVLEQYTKRLQRAEAEVTPAQLRVIRETLIRHDLDGHIERKLLVQSLRSTLAKEQLDMFEKQLDKAFEQRVENMKAQLNVNSRHELEIKLQEQQATSLANLRSTFVNQLMAVEFLKSKAEKNEKIGRPELIRYYEEHIDDYAIPSRVKWQQLLIDFEKNGGREQAFDELENAIDELKSGADFGAVAAKYSNGPKANKNGHWGWLDEGSLSDEKIEKALFELPVDMISQVLVGERGYHLVKVNGRQAAGRVAFTKVQSKIQKTLEEEAKQKATQDVIDEMYENAVIETIFDESVQQTLSS